MVGNVYAQCAPKQIVNVCVEGAPKKRRPRIGESTKLAENEEGGRRSSSNVFSRDDVLDIRLLDSFLSVHADDQNSFRMCGELIEKNKKYSSFLKKKLGSERFGIDTREFDSRKGPDVLKNACNKLKRRIVNIILEDFKHEPNEEKREKYNEILRQYGRKIEKIPDVATDHNVQLVVRGAFEGEFSAPSRASTAGGLGYSRGYRKFANPYNEELSDVIVGGKLSADYDWSKNPAVKAMSLSENMSRLIPDLQAAVKHQHIPQEVVEKLSISDVAHILYKEKNGGKMPEELQKICFKSLNDKCDEGFRIKFWREFGKDKVKTEKLKSLLESKGVSKDYICDLLLQIKEKGKITLDMNNYQGVIPKLSVHHKMYVQDSAFLGADVMKIDDYENFTAVVDFPDEDNHEGFEHAADTKDSHGNAYRLINLGDTEKETVYLQAGLKSYAAPRLPDYEKRKTYRDFALKEVTSERFN